MCTFEVNSVTLILFVQKGIHLIYKAQSPKCSISKTQEQELLRPKPMIKLLNLLLLAVVSFVKFGFQLLQELLGIDSRYFLVLNICIRDVHITSVNSHSSGNCLD